MKVEIKQLGVRVRRRRDPVDRALGGVRGGHGKEVYGGGTKSI